MSDKHDLDRDRLLVNLAKGVAQLLREADPERGCRWPDNSNRELAEKIEADAAVIDGPWLTPSAD